MAALMGRLEQKHWMLIAGFLTSTASVISGLDHWHDLVHPPIIAGLIAQLATLLGAVFAGAPPNPHHRRNRRRTDGQHVSDSTRRKL